MDKIIELAREFRNRIWLQESRKGKYVGSPDVISEQIDELLDLIDPSKPETIPYVDWSRVPAPPTDKKTVLSYQDGEFVWVDWPKSPEVCEATTAPIREVTTLEVGDIVQELNCMRLLLANHKHVMEGVVVSLNPFQVVSLEGEPLHYGYLPQHFAKNRHGKKMPAFGLEVLLKKIALKNKTAEVLPSGEKPAEKHMICELAIATRDPHYNQPPEIAIRHAGGSIKLIPTGEWFKSVYEAEFAGYSFSPWEEHTVGAKEAEVREPVLERAEFSRNGSGQHDCTGVRFPGRQSFIVLGRGRGGNFYWSEGDAETDNTKRITEWTPLYS